MTEGQRAEEPPSPELVRVVRDLFGVSIADPRDAWQGEESIGWRGTSIDGDRFVQRFPHWRDVDDLAWCDSVAAAASSAAPSCVHAIPSVDGRVVVETAEGPVMVFPYIDGHHPAEGERIARQAAALLAAMHQGIASTWAGPVGGRFGDRRMTSAVPSEGPLVDAALDRWEQATDASTPGLPIHGDFYGGNLIVSDGRIAGVIDWSDANLAHREQEVAWAAWEFCQDDRGEDLVDEEAETFLRVYVDSGGPADVGPPFDPIPWIRRRLRWEAGSWFADPRSRIEVSDYHEAQIVAFQRLRTRRLATR